ncbi:MAG: alpha/beta hydrolase [Oscillospiraceae bacterium]|nr:alpha/beta hydrolase [Oscillospiraceae bacterium]
MGIFDCFRKVPEKDPFTVSTFNCKRNGMVICGTEYRPEGNNLPIAIVCHGFMAWQDTVRQYAKELARMGYCAYCFDFCGGSVMKKGKSDGATTDMSVLTEVQDLEAVIEYVQSLSYNSSDLLLMGCSQGGFVSALVAAKHPELVNKLVLFYPALCIPDDARSGKMMFARFDPKNIPERINCGPMKLGRCYVADVIGMDPYEKIKSYRGPVLIVHGTKDSIVKLDYSRRAQRAYPNAKLHIIEGGTHGFGKKHDAIAIAHLKRFLS